MVCKGTVKKCVGKKDIFVWKHAEDVFWCFAIFLGDKLGLYHVWLNPFFRGRGSEAGGSILTSMCKSVRFAHFRSLSLVKHCSPWGYVQSGDFIGSEIRLSQYLPVGSFSTFSKGCSKPGTTQQNVRNFEPEWNCCIFTTNRMHMFFCAGPACWRDLVSLSTERSPVVQVTVTTLCSLPTLWTERIQERHTRPKCPLCTLSAVFCNKHLPVF